MSRRVVLFYRSVPNPNMSLCAALYGHLNRATKQQIGERSRPCYPPRAGVTPLPSAGAGITPRHHGRDANAVFPLVSAWHDARCSTWVRMDLLYSAGLLFPLQIRIRVIWTALWKLPKPLESDGNTLNTEKKMESGPWGEQQWTNTAFWCWWTMSSLVWPTRSFPK